MCQNASKTESKHYLNNLDSLYIFSIFSRSFFTFHTGMGRRVDIASGERKDFESKTNREI